MNQPSPKVAVLLFLLLFGASPAAPAQSESRPEENAPATRPAPKDVSRLLKDIPARRNVPGVVAAFVDRNGAVAIGAAGVRRRGDAAPVLVDDPFHLGSCTKAMTATLCGLAVDDGTLRFDTTIGEVFPKLATEENAAWRSVTLHHLLTNSGGVPSDLAPNGLWRDLCRHEGTPFDARRKLLNGVLRGAPLSAPGEKYLYSNAGFAIAGHMLETRLESTYEDLLTKRVFIPLGMTRAGFGAPGTTASLDAPRGHGADGKPVEPGPNADNPPAITPAGRVYAPIEDWAKFIAWHLRGAAGEGAPLRNETFAILHAAGPGQGADYASGWVRASRPWAGGEVLTHSGSNTMWFCVAWLAPKRGFAAVAACNQGGDGGAAAADDAVTALFGAAKELWAGAPR